MGKSLFTIIFLVIALLFVVKVQDFIKNNSPEPAIPESSFVELSPEIYTDTTATTTDTTTSTTTATTTDSM